MRNFVFGFVCGGVALFSLMSSYNISREQKYQTVIAAQDGLIEAAKEELLMNTGDYGFEDGTEFDIYMEAINNLYHK